MDFPKLVIASNGRCTGMLLDGVFIGTGIKRVDFSTQDDHGDMKSTIRILDLDVGSVNLVRDSSQFEDFIKKLAVAE